MVDSIATMALETLRELLVEEAKFLSSVNVHAEEVRRNLNTMHSFLKDADKRRNRYESHRVRNWVAELRELSTEAEDVLERYVILNISKRQGKSLKEKLKRFTCILGECLSTHEIGCDIEDIRSRMVDLTKTSETIYLGEASSSNEESEIQLLRKTFGHVIDENYVGMEDDIKHLLSIVMSQERAHRVILINGMGGLGKTTIARKIFQNKDVQGHFETCAWFCVSQEFDAAAVFRGVLKKLCKEEDKEKVDKYAYDELVEKLYDVQRIKKCLVILDDIWKTEHWAVLSSAFPIVETCCKVLITSRYESVITADYYVHKLRYLTENEGWELIQKVALPSDYTKEVGATELENLEQIGRSIVKKCGCLPLAISIIGGILRQERSVNEWEKVNESIDAYLQHGNDMENYGRVSQILDLSYNVLPYHLKPCFLYLSVFPEDEEIDVEQLYLLWMAEGMISLEGIKGRGLEVRDVAQLYLTELASRCMVEVTKDKESPYNRFESCRLHDLMRDRCLLKGKEEGFLDVVDTEVERKNISFHCNYPRLAVHSNGEVDEYVVEGNQKMRSFLLIEKSDYWNGQKSIVGFGELRHLKSLILKNIKFKNGKLPKGIEKMVLLKLLHIEYCELDELPVAVCNLSHLQYLLVLVGDIKVPNYLYRLRRLKSLHFRRNFKVIVSGGGRLKLDDLDELEILIGFDSEKYDISSVLRREKLRVLKGRIYDGKVLSIIVDYILSHESRFRETSLTIDRACNMNAEESGLLCKLLEIKSLLNLSIWCIVKHLPTYKSQLCPNLASLCLCDCEIEEDPMVVLGKLPKLKTLQLWSNAFAGKEMRSLAYEFPQLRFLLISSLPNLEEWRVDENSMPLLEKLEINRCKKLKMIPDGLKFITTLQRMDIECMSDEFMETVKSGGRE